MDHSSEHHNLRARVVRSLFFQFIAKGGERLLRLVAYAVLARILSEGDFGLMAAVAAALGAIDALTYLPTEAAITASPRGREPRFLDTVFWIQLVRGIAIALCVVAVSPLLARFYDHPDQWPLFAIIALQPLFVGLTSPRSEVLVKDLKMAAWSMARFAASAIGLGVTITLAVILKSAWALVLGQLATQAAVTVGGHIIAPYRPGGRPDKDCWAEIRSYCFQAAGIPVLIALVYQAPAFILGKVAGLGMLGIFTLNKAVADLPIQVALGVVGQVAVPAYATMRHDQERLARAWLVGLRWIATLAIPAAAALVWVDAAIPRLVYGEKYEGASYLFGLLAIDGTLTALIAVTGSLFWGVGRPSYDRWSQLVRVAVLYPLGILLTSTHGANGIALSLAVSSAVTLVVGMSFAARITGLTAIRILREGLAPGLVGAALIAIALVGVDLVATPAGFVRIAIAIAAGAAWIIAGPVRPMLLQLRRRKAAPTLEPLPTAA